MSAPADRLPERTHARILLEKVVPDSGLHELLSHEHPKAIILGGQPGAGKGGLADMARNELGSDVVTIDPDELRNYHPNVAEFQSTNPYTWSGRTQADAGQWADELRDAAVAQKKNFIFDSTLSNGQWTSDLIKELQAKGYEVEVRVVAAHKLESELGVDARFSGSLDARGYGRHVPAEAREAIYSKVPASLDTIHARTDAPIRIFDREGKELYDSRRDVRLPGPALEEAREARLRDPGVTRDLSRGWREQLHWHETLPRTVADNARVAPGTAQSLLVERSALNVVESVQHDAAQASRLDSVLRVRPMMIKGAVMAGEATVVYEGISALRRSDQLLDQGNRVGAQSEVLHFGGRTLGMFGGAALGAELGAAGGWETGPGALITTTAGGIAGAVAGDKIVTAVDNYRIYSQEDKDGHTWHMDPQQPAKGWTRTIESTHADVDPGDYQLRPFAHRSQTVTADPALADRLNYQASSVAVDMALAHAPLPQDPYALPASSHDAPSIRDSPWVRDAQTHAWSRTVVTGVLEHGMLNQHIEPASPQRTAELDRAAEAVLAHNATQTPHAIAARYQAAYAQFGWDRFGPPPESVTHRLKQSPDHQQGPDGNDYTRDANGQWTTSHWYGERTAEGNLKDELDDARRRQSDAGSIAAPAQADTARKAAEPVTRHSSDREMFDALCTAAQNKDVDTMRTVGQAYLQSDRGQAWLAEGHQLNQQQAMAQQQATLHAQQQPQAPQGPVR